jgi:ApbE superfamily uncharacterized protein (UPF0280 family)
MFVTSLPAYYNIIIHYFFICNPHARLSLTWTTLSDLCYQLCRIIIGEEMQEYTVRNYRNKVNARGMISFNVVIKETDLRVSAEKDLAEDTRDMVVGYRRQLEHYIQAHPNFLTTLSPYPREPFAPSIVQEMINATGDIGVGPMASVAGAIAQFVGMDLLKSTGQVIIENGGDIFMKLKREATVSIFAGESPLSNRVGIRVAENMMPIGICSSSGKVGHSLSMGSSDVITVLSASAIRADGAATALGNRIRKKADLERVSEWADSMGGIIGGVAILGGSMAMWGGIELVAL